MRKKFKIVKKKHLPARIQRKMERTTRQETGKIARVSAGTVTTGGRAARKNKPTRHY